MTIAKALAHGVRAAILGVILAGCAYDTGAAGWDGAYTANDVYDGFYGPEFLFDGVGDRHWDDYHLLHYSSHVFPSGAVYGGGFGRFHSGGMHIAHAGGFGGHGRA